MKAFSKTIYRSLKSHEEIVNSTPLLSSLVVRKKRDSTIQLREEVLEKTGCNAFGFPAMFVAVDMLSDSGSTSMLDSGWASLFHGDESYGRNSGYYCLLDSFRDCFERDEENYLLHEMFSPYSEKENPEDMIHKLIPEVEEFGFVNSNQIANPNCFLTPQGRCAEFLLFNTIHDCLIKNNKDGKDAKYFIPSNGFFDTTRANCQVSGIFPLDIQVKPEEKFKVEDIGEKNPFLGNIDTEKLVDVIETFGKEMIPIVLMTVTNNTGGGQIVSMENLKEVKEICDAYDLVFWLDACRFSENAYFIKRFEEGYADKSVRDIVKEMFSLVDGFHISLKKDGLANMGGVVAFHNDRKFKKQFGEDVGTTFKEKQILTFGNDSYGGISGRDLMTIAQGLYDVTDENYLQSRCGQVEYFAKEMALRGIPVVLPPGGHALYIDVDEFFPDRHWSEFAGCGLVAELLRLFAVRACELGAFAFEFDKREKLTGEEHNYVRFALPRNTYSKDHIDYSVDAVDFLYQNRDKIPSMRIKRGAELNLRHFQSDLEPIGNWMEL